MTINSTDKQVDTKSNRFSAYSNKQGEVLMDFDENTMSRMKINIRREAISRFSKNLNYLLNFYDTDKLKDMNKNLFSKKIFGEGADEEFKKTMFEMMIYFGCKSTIHSLPVNTFNLCRMIEKSGHNIWEHFSDREENVEEECDDDEE